MSRHLSASMLLVAALVAVVPTARASGAPAPKRPKLALLAVTGGVGYDGQRLHTVEELLLDALQATGAFTVIGQSDINALLTAEAKKQAAGCTDTGCMAEIAGALGTDYIATASVGKLDKVTVLSVKVIDTVRTLVVARATHTVRSGDKLVEATTAIALQIVTTMGLAPPASPPPPKPSPPPEPVASRPSAESEAVVSVPAATVPIVRVDSTSPETRAKTVAVLYFDYEQTSFPGLRKGLAQMLISDLSGIDGVVVVERDRLEEILAELKLAETHKFDPSSVARLGKLLGARYLIMGGYFDMGGALRVDARIVEVETGKVVYSVGGNCAPDRFMDLEQKLAGGLGNKLSGAIGSGNVPTSAPPVNPAGQLRTMTVSRYGDALDKLDHGNKIEARQALEEVVKDAPDFTAAVAALQHI